MPSILSKLLMAEWSFPYNCYEVSHTWTPECSAAAVEAAIITFRQSVKLYFPFYFLQQIVFKRRFDGKSCKQTASSVLRSSCFVSFLVFSFVTFFCGVRRMSGRFYWSLSSWLPSLVSSGLAILIERPSRRQALAVYCANLASDTVYRNLVDNNYIKPIPNGETILFTISVSILLYIIRKNGYSNDPISLALKMILGQQEFQRTALTSTTPPKHCQINKQNNFINYKPIKHYIDKYLPPRHRLCPHKHSCVIYSVSAFLKSLAIGWSAHVALQLWINRRRVYSYNSIMKGIIKSETAFKFGLFTAAFSSLFKTINCLLRWTTDQSEDWHAFLSGLLSGPVMLLSPNSTISMYLLWKCIESMFCLVKNNGYIKHSDEIVNLVFAISSTQLFYAFILSPKLLPKSFKRFITNVTENRLSQINRLVLDVFGTGASNGYENFFPDLDIKYLSKHFQETILIWLI